MAWHLSSRLIGRRWSSLLSASKGSGTLVQAAGDRLTGDVQSLSDLVDEITSAGVVCNLEERKGGVSRALRATTIRSFCKSCASIERPFSAESASVILSKLAKLVSNGEGGEGRGINALVGKDREILADIGAALNKDVSPKVAVDSLLALLSLGIDKGDLFNNLLAVLKNGSCSQASDVEINQLVRLSIALRSSQCADRDQLQRLVYNLIELKTSEIRKPADFIFLMSNCYISSEWFESLLQKIKDYLPLMITGDLVTLLEQLAKRHQNHNEILPLIAAALTNNSTPLLVTQLGTVANSIATLRFADARLLRKLAEDVVLNRNNFKKWSHVTSIVAPFAKLRFGHLKAWEVLAAWINENYKTASLSDLSRAISACAICDKGHLVKEAGEYLANNLYVEHAPSPSVWLNSIYSLAICNTLTPRLAETVLRAEFLKQFTHEENLAVKVFNFSKLAQIQAYIQCVFRDKYRGPVMKLDNYIKLDEETNNKAAVLKYGSRGVYNADLFHNIIYKLAPLNSHAVGPFLSGDGFFVDAIVQVDDNSRFVKIEDFNSLEKPVLAIIFLTSKQVTITCDASEESQLLGAVSLGKKLLERRGMIPVIFSEVEINSKKFLAQKIEFVRNRLLTAAGKL